MFGKKLYVMVIGILVMAALLVACGDSTPTTAPAATTVAGATTASSGNGATAGGTPSVAGASAISPLPEALKQAAQAYSAGVPNGKLEAFKVGDAASKVKGTVTDSFKKDGWSEQTATIPSSATAPLESQGYFFLYFLKGGKVATVVGYPGSVASALGASVGANDTLYLVITGGN